MKKCRRFTLSTLGLALGSWGFAAHAQAQALPAAQPSQRLEIGAGFSIAAPGGDGWRKTADPATFLKVLGPEHHSLVLMANTGPSGITKEDILGFREPGGVDTMIKLMARFFSLARKAHAVDLEGLRYELLEMADETQEEATGKYNIGKFFCTYSRIVVRDREHLVDGSPTRLRFAAYTCLEFPDMRVAAQVSYSERGREQDLSDEALAEGERFVRSLERAK